MKIKLISVGQKMPAWVNTGVKEYTQRMPRDFSVDLIEVPMAQRTKNTVIAKAMEKEAAAITSSIAEGSHTVALEVKGKPWSTEQLAEQMQRWQQETSNVALLVGGPDGLLPSLSKQAHQRWSLSPLTFPHPLVRVIVAEQLYRAWSLNNGHPYHRAG